MAVKLHNAGYDHAKKLVADAKVALDERDDWSEYLRSAAEENAFIETQGYPAYGRWLLGIDNERPADTKGHYKFPLRRLRSPTVSGRSDDQCCGGERDAGCRDGGYHVSGAGEAAAVATAT